MAKTTKSRRFADLHQYIRQDVNGKITNIISDNATVDNLQSSNLTGGDASFSGTVEITGSLGPVQTIPGTGTVEPGSFVTTVLHSGTGTLSVGIEDWPVGAQMSIVTNGTLTIDWGTGSKGVSLGNSVKMASGIFDGVKWFYSEANTN